MGIDVVTLALAKGYTDEKIRDADCGKIKNPDWNQNDETAPDYIKNRPFYQDTVIDITWDGNTEGLDSIEGHIPFYKVSGTAPEKNDISGSEIVLENDGVQEVGKTDEIGLVEGENCILIGEFVAIVYAENATQGPLIFPTPGVWFLRYGTRLFTRSLKKTTTKTLDAKYLPEIPATKLPIISFTAESSTSNTGTCNTTYNDAVNLVINGNIRASFYDNTKYYYCVSASKGNYTTWGGDCLIFKFQREYFKTANTFGTETKYVILEKSGHVVVFSA